MITVIGSINLDLTAAVERLPGPGETVPGDRFSTAPGGKGANQALAARRAGAQVRVVGAIGGDSFGAEAIALLKHGGVDLSGVRESAAVTGAALILVGGDGENMIAVVPGANNSVLSGDVENAQIGKGEYVLLQHEIPMETIEAAIAAAHRAGAVSVLNTAPFRAEAARFIGKADHVVANETEFDLYCELQGLKGDGREARMRAFAESTGHTIIVTLGADGVLVAAGAMFFHVPAMQISAVDTVGAGDTFCGYFAAGLDEGLDLEGAVRRAALAGSLACLKHGAQPAIPSRRAVDDAMAH